MISINPRKKTSLIWKLIWFDIADNKVFIQTISFLVIQPVLDSLKRETGATREESMVRSLHLGIPSNCAQL